MKTIEIPEGMETKLFVMSEDALKDVPEALKSAFPGRRPWIVADENTFAAAGKKVLEYLKTAEMNPYEPKIFPGHPIMHASEELAQGLFQIMPENSVPVAVGSGTINDITKRASGLKDIPYCCVATACSVDGYTSSGAALLVNGFKKTMPCPAPYAVVADTLILKTAPSPMMAGGYADLMAKIYGGADWVIVDELGIEPIDGSIWQLVQAHLREWLADGSNLFNIFHGLCNTGYAMQLYKDSRPASGAEHLFSHTWEMEKFTCNGESVSHGFQVGIGMLLSAQLQGFLVEHDVETVRKMAEPALNREQRIKEIDSLISGGNYGSAKEVALAKFLDGAAAQERRELIFSHWEAMRKRVKAQYIPLKELKEMLRKAHCPASHHEIKMSNEQYLHAIFTAQLIRKRYTILDLLYEAGLLKQAVKNISLD